MWHSSPRSFRVVPALVDFGHNFAPQFPRDAARSCEICWCSVSAILWTCSVICQSAFIMPSASSRSACAVLVKFVWCWPACGFLHWRRTWALNICCHIARDKFVEYPSASRHYAPWSHDGKKQLTTSHTAQKQQVAWDKNVLSQNGYGVLQTHFFDLWTVFPIFVCVFLLHVWWSSDCWSTCGDHFFFQRFLNDFCHSSPSIRKIGPSGWRWHCWVCGGSVVWMLRGVGAAWCGWGRVVPTRRRRRSCIVCASCHSHQQAKRENCMCVAEPPGFTRQPKSPNVHIFKVLALRTPSKFYEKTRRRKNGGRGKSKGRNWTGQNWMGGEEGGMAKWRLERSMTRDVCMSMSAHVSTMRWQGRQQEEQLKELLKKIFFKKKVVIVYFVATHLSVERSLCAVFHRSFLSLITFVETPCQEHMDALYCCRSCKATFIAVRFFTTSRSVLGSPHCRIFRRVYAATDVCSSRQLVLMHVFEDFLALRKSSCFFRGCSLDVTLMSLWIWKKLSAEFVEELVSLWLVIITCVICTGVQESLRIVSGIVGGKKKFLCIPQSASQNILTRHAPRCSPIDFCHECWSTLQLSQVDNGLTRHSVQMQSNHLIWASNQTEKPGCLKSWLFVVIIASTDQDTIEKWSWSRTTSDHTIVQLNLKVIAYQMIQVCIFCHFLSFSFVFFHFPSCSFLFFHFLFYFLALSFIFFHLLFIFCFFCFFWVLKIWFFLGLMFFDGSSVKNKFLGLSRGVPL